MNIMHKPAMAWENILCARELIKSESLFKDLSLMQYKVAWSWITSLDMPEIIKHSLIYFQHKLKFWYYHSVA